METLTDLMCFSRLGESIPVAAYRRDEWDDKMTGAEGSQMCGKKGEGERERKALALRSNQTDLVSARTNPSRHTR